MERARHAELTSIISIFYNTATDPNAIYFDSGATRHMCEVRDYFADLQVIPQGVGPSMVLVTPSKNKIDTNNKIRKHKKNKSMTYTFIYQFK